MRQLTILPHLDFSLISAHIPVLVRELNADYPTWAHIVPFSNSKQLLGQEFPYAIYDMRTKGGICLHLEALAIVTGTIQHNGTLYLLCPHFTDLEQQLDFDALRWNAKHPIPCPHFYGYFKHLITHFGFQTSGQFNEEKGQIKPNPPPKLTPEQQQIAQKLPLNKADIHLITAHRGRGKSTLCGQLANQLAERHTVLVTAHSQATLTRFFQQTSAKNITFIAPDKLIQQIDAGEISETQWLFIEEAASLPLSILHRLCHYFSKVILTTTTDNYEGTGQGFRLKFLSQLNRASHHWQLTAPLRWADNDPLEQFIQQLLLLTENTLETLPNQFKFYPDFYRLLALAHYKSTPTDLRRLFDAPNQMLYPYYEDQQLIAGAWLINEGGIDTDLTKAIWRGERRPPGNLVAQYLCFQANLPDACHLRSVRISRIAVQPEKQRQGYGRRLVLQLFSQIDPLVDFMSVSFGLNATLYQFWQQCGFQLVQITPTQEASSGLHSAIMLRPITSAGETLVKHAVEHYWRDMPLLPFTHTFHSFLPIVSTHQSTLTFTQEDWQNLTGFAYHQRTFSACYSSLVRFSQHYPDVIAPLSTLLHSTTLQINKTDLTLLRSLFRQFFEKRAII